MSTFELGSCHGIDVDLGRKGEGGTEREERRNGQRKREGGREERREGGS